VIGLAISGEEVIARRSTGIIQGIDLVRSKANARLRTRQFGRIVEPYIWVIAFSLLVVMVLKIASMARNRLPPDTPLWAEQMLFWVVSLSLVVGVISVGAISAALRTHRSSFRIGNRVKVTGGTHKGCLGVVRGKRTEIIDTRFIIDKKVHVSVALEKDGTLLREDFREDELIKVDFRSRWF